MGPNDPRKQPWAYITDGKRLYEVLKVTERRQLELEDCGSLMPRLVDIGSVTRHPWKLVRAAPTASADNLPA